MSQFGLVTFDVLYSYTWVADGYCIGVVYRFNMISKPLIYDLRAVALIYLFMSKTKKKERKKNLIKV